MLINLFGIYFHILEIPLLGFLLIAVIVQFAQKGTKLKIRQTPLVFWIIFSLVLFICSILISAVNATDRGLVIKATIKWLEVLAIVALLFFYIDNEKRFRIIYFFLFLSVFLAIVHVLLSILGGEKSILSFRIFPSYESVFAFALILPFCDHRKGWRVGFLAAVSLIAVLLSMSRGAWLAAAAIFIYGYFFLSRSIKRTLLFGFAAIILTGLFFPAVRELVVFRIETISSDVDASNVERLALYKIAWYAFTRNPVLGVGALNFPHFFIREGLVEGISAEKIELLEPHNTFLQIAAEEGIFGLLFFCILIISSWYLLKKCRTVQHDLLFGLTGFFIVMLFNFMFGYISGQFRFYLGILIGLILSLSRVSQPGKRENESPC
ncbi:O-antigen ligase family protein [candidate division KSB1 bacterium]|nr:O-antigen ligase family protein [candidate division KSB1 bacterium]